MDLNLSGPALQQQRQGPDRTLTSEQIDEVINIIANHTNSYVEPSRNDFVYGLSGHLFHNGISEPSATKLVSMLGNEANDEEADQRLDVVRDTYNKGKIGKPVLGISQLRYLLAKNNNENEVHVNEIIAELNEKQNPK